MTPSTFIIAIISFASSSKLESNVDKYSPYETPSGHLSLSLSLSNLNALIYLLPYLFIELIRTVFTLY